MRLQHMDPAEAVQAFRDLGARSMLAMHWGVFDLTDEPVDLAPRVLQRILSEEGDESFQERIHTLAVGERWRLP
jgi:L-ascorbate metabolism protein UlaG (beta-lactamase superfamily)